MFQLEPDGEQTAILDSFFKTCSEIVEACIDKDISLGITSRKRLHEVVYRQLRAEYHSHPSHCFYTAITQAPTIFKSYSKIL